MTILNFPLSTYTPPEEPVMTEEEERIECAERQLYDTYREARTTAGLDIPTLIAMDGTGRCALNYLREAADLIEGKMIEIYECQPKGWFKRWIAKHFSIRIYRRTA